jgi:methylmalonyl-CoA/ethylmalonyl-CoA epimerase
MKQIEHIGIAVRQLQEAIPLFEKLLASPCYKQESVPQEKVITAFFQTGNCKIELLESTDPDSAIGRFLDQRGEGLHHIAFEVEDLQSEMGRLKKEGFEFVHESPRPGADNKLVAFLHPRTTGRVLVELCMEIPK